MTTYNTEEKETRYMDLKMSSLSGNDPPISARDVTTSEVRHIQTDANPGGLNHRCLVIMLIIFIVLVIVDTCAICFLAVKVVEMKSSIEDNGRKIRSMVPTQPPLQPENEGDQNIGSTGSPGPVEHKESSSAQPRQAGGAIYTRWGRTSCAHSGSDLIYPGIVGGAHYTHDGSGANYLCLHTEPQWLNYRDGYQHSAGRALLYGAEYKIPDDIFPNKDLVNNDVPCAVCQTQHRFSIIMIPGRIQCPNSSWVMEYKGYLMTQNYSYKGKTTFECVDENPETIDGGGEDRKGVLFYPTEVRCGSLPCPKYVDGREMACVVCSF